jgi:excinuclease ABC subunit C
MPFVFDPRAYPEQPGCYMMKNSAEQIIYIGKAKNLRNRLRSYFRQNLPTSKLRQLNAEIAGIEVVLVANETESLLLENNLIKLHKPKYNRALKRDNSGYAYLELTDEPIPRLMIHYRSRKAQPLGSGAKARKSRGPAGNRPTIPSDSSFVSSIIGAKVRRPAISGTGTKVSKHAISGNGTKMSKPVDSDAGTKVSKPASSTGTKAYLRASSSPAAPAGQPVVRRFGPYPNGRFRNALLEFVNEHYGLRSCRHMPKRVCLLYHIGKCSGICEGKVSNKEYLEAVRRAEALLSNKENELILELKREMERHAERLEFEKAGRLMVQIRSLEKLLVKQVVDRNIAVNQDVLYFGEHYVMVARLQAGMVRGMEFAALDGESQDPYSADRFLVQRYCENRPDEIIVNRINDPAAVRKALRTYGKGAITITVPRRGAKLALLEICRHNFEHRMQSLISRSEEGSQQSG